MPGKVPLRGGRIPAEHVSNGVHPAAAKSPDGGAIPNRYETPAPPLGLTENQFDRWMRVQNDQTSMTRDVLQRLMDPRRDLESECGYPLLGTSIGADFYKQLYDRDPIAARVVECEPKESWKVQPSVYETEDEDDVTEFEEAWDALGSQLAGNGGWYADEGGSLVWDYLRRLDMRSRIGHFGILLLGFDDGKGLDVPVEGMVTTTNTVKYVYKTDETGFYKLTVNGKRIVDHVEVRRTNPRSVMPDSPVHPNEEAAIRAGVPVTNTRQDRVVNPATKEVTYEWKTTTVRSAPAQHELTLVENWVAEREMVANKLNTVKPMTSQSKEIIDSGDSMPRGTEAQYYGTPLGPTEEPTGEVSKRERKLLFVRPYSEDLVQVVRWEWNPHNPRFGQPVMYRVTLNDPREAHSGIGLPLATVYVHWTRVVHLADTSSTSSEVFGKPAMEQVLNNLLGLRKVYAADPEAYWRGCFTILTMETHPQLGGDVLIDEGSVRDALENMQNSSQRTGIGRGLSLKSTAPTVVDPTPHVAVQLEAICIKIAVPVRVFKGSERGELASSQDDSSHNDRMTARENFFITPKIICPFVDRLISCGVLPEPGEDGFTVEWPDLDAQTDLQKAQVMLARTQAYGVYVAQGVEQLIPPKDYMTRFDSMEPDHADTILDAAEKLQAEEDEANAALADQHGMIPEAPEGMKYPEPGEPGGPPPPPPGPVSVKPGDKLVHPATGKTVAQGNPVPKPKVPTTNESIDDAAVVELVNVVPTADEMYAGFRWFLGEG